MEKDRVISVIGLGYVGLPVAVSFALSGFDVVAFDIDEERLDELSKGFDRTNEVPEERLNAASLCLTSDPTDLERANFHIVTVPTPIDAQKRPDLTPLQKASELVGKQLGVGDIVVYESTVYPGATEEICVPILEKESGLVFGRDFFVGYSPERINPGDKEHSFETITKVVSGSDDQTLETVAGIYGYVVKVGVHRAASIKVAEAAKVIENTQRDLNIAFMNELAKICHLMDIDTRDVLDAAGTKWNFINFIPGLVGGHCIGVDPYYLTHKAEQEGYDPEVILAGRRINDDMGDYVAGEIIRQLPPVEGAPRITVLGVTFKENVPDIRNSKVIDFVNGLQIRGAEVQVHDPIADPAHTENDLRVTLKERDSLEPADAVVLCVPHEEYLAGGWGAIQALLKNRTGLVGDLKSMLPVDSRPDEISLWRL